MADTNNLPVATRKTLEKLVAAIGYLGLEKTDIVQLKAFLQPMSEVGVVRTEIVNFFGGAAPPVVFVEWISPAPNPPIEIELIAGGGGDFSKEVEAISFLTPPGTTGLEGVQPRGPGESRRDHLCVGALWHENGGCGRTGPGDFCVVGGGVEADGRRF